MTADNFRAPDGLLHLYQHFLENGMIRSISCGNEELLEMTGRQIMAAAASGGDWEKWVPEEAQSLVKAHSHV